MYMCDSCQQINFNHKLSFEEYTELVEKEKNLLPSHKGCTTCKQVLPIENFGKGSKRNKYGLKPKCKKCDSQYMKKYYTKKKA